MQEATGGRRAPRAVAGTREYWAGQLMQPEWMIDVPEDLATSWWASVGSPALERRDRLWWTVSMCNTPRQCHCILATVFYMPAQLCTHVSWADRTRIFQVAEPAQGQRAPSVQPQMLRNVMSRHCRSARFSGAVRRYVMCRPEGQRCVLVAVGGSTVSRLRNGVQLHRFQSALPGGSGSTAGGGSDAITILDTVCQPETSTYYVIDLMCWKVGRRLCSMLCTSFTAQSYLTRTLKRADSIVAERCRTSPCHARFLAAQGVSYYDCSAEFRQYWLHAKLAELDSMSQQPHALQALPAYPFTSGACAPLVDSLHHHPAFHQPPCSPAMAFQMSVLRTAAPGTTSSSGLLPGQARRVFTWTLCTTEGLRAAYDGPVPYQRDGLYLLHKEGHYALGLSPLALLWKDAACSRYFVDTDAAGNALPQQVMLETTPRCHR